ncbi:hypothetical protein ACMFMG_002526 [Clarireedia jacksonii]
MSEDAAARAARRRLAYLSRIDDKELTKIATRSRYEYVAEDEKIACSKDEAKEELARRREAEKKAMRKAEEEAALKRQETRKKEEEAERAARSRRDPSVEIIGSHPRVQPTSTPAASNSSKATHPTDSGRKHASPKQTSTSSAGHNSANTSNPSVGSSSVERSSKRPAKDQDQGNGDDPWKNDRRRDTYGTRRRETKAPLNFAGDFTNEINAIGTGTTTTTAPQRDSAARLPSAAEGGHVRSRSRSNDRNGRSTEDRSHRTTTTTATTTTTTTNTGKKEVKRRRTHSGDSSDSEQDRTRSRHRKQAAGSEDKAAQNRCPNCDKTFGRVCTGGEKKMIKCEVPGCSNEKGFSRKDALQRHMRTKHPEL